MTVETMVTIDDNEAAAYSPCIAHGVDLKNNQQQQTMAVRSGHWPLYRFDPRRLEAGKNPLKLDSKKPDIALKDYYQIKTRFSMLWRTHPDTAEHFIRQGGVMARFHHLEQLTSPSVTELSEEDS